MEAINMKRYEALRAKVPGNMHINERQAGRKTPEKRTLNQWRDGIARLSDMFTRAASGEQDDGRGGRESFGQLKPKPQSNAKTPEQELEKQRRLKRDQDKER